MKYLLLFLYTSLCFAQNINKLDTNGKRHGIWKKTYPNTDVLRYEGEFFHGKQIGVFKYYKNIKNKAVLAAKKQFNKTDSIAYVTFLSSNGKIISEGEMNGKKYIGTWKYYQKTNDYLLILEHYNNQGNLDGERLVYYKNGKVAEKETYRNGKLNGVSIWYTETNTVLKTFVYEKGELHGSSKYYNPKGELMVEGNYKKGKKHGIWKYYKNGKLIKEKNFTYKTKINK